MLIISDLSCPCSFAAHRVLKLKARRSAADHSPENDISTYNVHLNHTSGHAHLLESKGSQRANAQHKNHQSVQISLQGTGILEHNARSLSLCSLVETVFRIHWHLIIRLISLLFRIAILVLCGGCHRNGCLILIYILWCAHRSADRHFTCECNNKGFKSDSVSWNSSDILTRYSLLLQKET